MRTIKQIEALVNDKRLTENEAIEYVIENYGNENENGNMERFPVIDRYCEVEQTGRGQVVSYGTYDSWGEIVDWSWEHKHFADGCEKDEYGRIFKKVFYADIYQFIDDKITIVSLYDVMEGTYDVFFNDNENSNSKGFEKSLKYCKEYIKANNGSNDSYFGDYKGGSVSIVCNETGETVYIEEIK